jgi:hypothetical protein
VKSIFIATPMYGGMCCGAYTSSLVATLGLLNAHGYRTSYSIMVNESLITRARNNLTDMFLASDCSHLFFIDADINFRKEDVLRMMEYDVPVLAGVYPKKLLFLDRICDSARNGTPFAESTGFEWVGAVGEDDDKLLIMNDPNAPLKKFVYAGTGFMMISRGVFQKLMPFTELYKNDFQGKFRETYNFFSLIVDPVSKILLSEDYYFCKMCNEHGIPIHIAPWVSLGHTGTYTFGLNKEV